ncbi:MAG: lysozyme-like domain containing protein [Pseudomonadota bacterium]|nr:MAG: lysozyme-like domain containing protein [Pseudomonadota bacterium]
MIRASNILLCFAALGVLAGCATTPVQNQDNICDVFEQEPGWYDDAHDSERRWGVPIAIQMAIVQRESSFRGRAKPERTRLLGFIPWRRPSSAEGYAQAQDPAWQDYLEMTGRSAWFASRSDMSDALDFIGWYNYTSHQRLGIRRNDAFNLYLAYHEGHGGYERGSWKNKPKVQQTAREVAERAERYARQLPACEDRFRCAAWWKLWPFCR